MQVAGAILGFFLLFGAMVGLLIVAGECTEAERPTAAAAFFAKYQARAPERYDSGSIDIEVLQGDGEQREHTVTRLLFENETGRVYELTHVNGVKTRERLMPPAGSSTEVFVGYLGAEARMPPPVAQLPPYWTWSPEPRSIRFRDDPRAAALGARQLIVEFASLQANESDLTQLLMIDAESYELIFAESNWGNWDAENRRWALQQSRLLSQINEPVRIPATAP